MQKTGSSRRGSRRPSFCLPTELTIGNNNAHASLPSSRGSKKIIEQTWNPNEADPFAKKRLGTYSGNVIDRRSLYSIKRENIASRELGFLQRPPSQSQNSNAQNNIEHQVEKNYIMNSRLKNATPEIFPKVILNHFFRVSAPSRTLGYGMPRPDTRETNQFKVIMEGLNREPSLVKIDSYPDLQTPINCDRTSEFCEILGPSSCSDCIENTNRHIGTELQHMLFPTIDMSMEKLIVPKLAHVLREGHRHQVRKRRMHELGLEIPNDLVFMKKQESHLTRTTCENCRRRINASKIVIKLPNDLASNRPSGVSTDRSAKSKRNRKLNNFPYI